MKILYFDCFGGISGDMVLGALIDAGFCPETLYEHLQLLGLKGFDLQVKKDTSHNIQGTRLQIRLEEYPQPHRSWLHISQIINESRLPAKIKQDAVQIFLNLAQAEGKVHGIAPEKVHFHEIGAIDSIIDIVGTAIIIHELDIEKVHCSPMPVAGGYIHCNHGLLPLPAPATAELLKGIPIRRVSVEGELVTPTGAAIAATLADSFGPLPAMTISQIGYGLGSNNYGMPNFLRVFIGEESGQQHKNEHLSGLELEEICVLQTNIDDMNPEILAFTAEKLLKEGALDISITPIIMKKGRHGSLLTILCFPGNESNLIKIVFRETTSLGVRTRREQRFVLPRDQIYVRTSYGQARIKISGTNDNKKISPEFEDCAKLAQETDVPLDVIYQSVMKAAEKYLNR